MNEFLERVYQWGRQEEERGTQSDLAGAAEYYADIIVGDKGVAPEIQKYFELVYEQGRLGAPLDPLAGLTEPQSPT